MLAISSDRFTDPNAPTACKSYKDVLAKLEELSARLSEPCVFSADVVWLVDQIRMRYRLDPIGLMGSPREPRVVLGTGYIPQAVVWYGSRRTTKGDYIQQFSLFSLNVSVHKGTPHTMRSNDAKTLARRLKSDMFELLAPEKNLYDFEAARLQVNNIRTESTYIPFIETELRIELYDYFASDEKIVTPGIDKWVKEKKELVDYSKKKIARREFIRSAFRERSVFVYKLPMIAEYRYCFIEVSADGQQSERVFFSDINDLVDRYPHIVGINNLLKLKKENIFSDADGFNESFNFIRTTNAAEVLGNTYSRLAIFSASRIPSEDEMLGKQGAQVIADEGKLSVLDF